MTMYESSEADNYSYDEKWRRVTDASNADVRRAVQINTILCCSVATLLFVVALSAWWHFPLSAIGTPLIVVSGSVIVVMLFTLNNNNQRIQKLLQHKREDMELILQLRRDYRVAVMQAEESMQHTDQAIQQAEESMQYTDRVIQHAKDALRLGRAIYEEFQVLAKNIDNLATHSKQNQDHDAERVNHIKQGLYDNTELLSCIEDGFDRSKKALDKMKNQLRGRPRGDVSLPNGKIQTCDQLLEFLDQAEQQAAIGQLAKLCAEKDVPLTTVQRWLGNVSAIRSRYKPERDIGENIAYLICSNRVLLCQYSSYVRAYVIQQPNARNWPKNTEPPRLQLGGTAGTESRRAMWILYHRCQGTSRK